MSFWIGLDAGTTGVTAVLFDRELRSVRRAYRTFAQSFPQPGWVEHQAADILHAVDGVLDEVIDGIAWDQLGGLGVTNQRETVFAFDASGAPLGPGIVWQDRRTAKRCAELSAHADTIRELTGLPLDPYFSATKIEWMRAHLPGADQPTTRWGTVDTLVVQHLTGEWATDPTNASRTMLFDIERQAWSAQLCDLFGIDPKQLPEVRPSIGDFGTWRGLPVCGVAGDQQAALLGQGGLAMGAAKCTFGTGTFLLVNSGQERPACPPGLLTTLAVGPTGAPCFALEGSVFMGGAIVQWLRDQMGFFADAAESQAIAASVPDSGGVILVPAFTGLGAPYWDPDARAAILGLTRGSERAHIVRAGLEAIAFQNVVLLERLRATAGLAVDELLVDGGATANDLLMQIQADLGAVSIRRPPGFEATARGAAALAALAQGAWTAADPPPGLVETAQRFEPSLAEDDRQARLMEWEAAVARVRSPSSA